MRENTMEELTQWMLDGPAWIRYNVLINLLDRKRESPQVISAYNDMLNDPKIVSLLADVQDWEHTLLKRHNDASHPIHKLSFLADIGIFSQEPGIQSAIKKILKHRSEEDPFQVFSNYPTNFGGSGLDEWLWYLCDAPLTIYILIKFGLCNNKSVLSALRYLGTLIRENGWPCAVCKTLGKFRGPGKKSDPCPYANLLMLKTNALINDPAYEENINIGVEIILGLWEHSREKRSYLFKMGTNFRKLKVPYIWYDILHVLNVLSQYKQAYSDPRFQSMLNVVRSKTGPDFRFTSESIWTKWKGWEFCQKREPSMWVTYSVLRTLKRVGEFEPI
jgi:hypothetical protein